MNAEPAYLTAARARHHEVTHNPEANPEEILAAEDALLAAEADARTESPA